MMTLSTKPALIFAVCLETMPFCVCGGGGQVTAFGQPSVSQDTL
jgi:hypothetical protein